MLWTSSQRFASVQHERGYIRTVSCWKRKEPVHCTDCSGKYKPAGLDDGWDVWGLKSVFPHHVGHQTDAHGRPAASLHCLRTGILDFSVTVLLIHILLGGLTSCGLVVGNENFHSLKIYRQREASCRPTRMLQFAVIPVT
jgi:hypothetical protein